MKIELGQAQKMLDWLKTKLYLDAISENAKTRTVKRGQVYRCNFGCGVGSEMQKDRPAIVVQNDIGNHRSGNTIVIPITHDTSVLPCMAAIKTQSDACGNTILDGQANVSNMMCVSKARLGDYVCELSTEDMRSVDEAIARTLGLMKYYSDMAKKLENKMLYIERIKEERNKAQDELATLRSILNLESNASLVTRIEEIKIVIDKTQKSN